MTELNTSKLVYVDDEVGFTGKRYSLRKVLETECFDDTQKTKTPSGDIYIIHDQTMLS